MAKVINIPEPITEFPDDLEDALGKLVRFKDELNVGIVSIVAKDAYTIIELCSGRHTPAPTNDPILLWARVAEILPEGSKIILEQI